MSRTSRVALPMMGRGPQKRTYGAWGALAVGESDFRFGALGAAPAACLL